MSHQNLSEYPFEGTIANTENGYTNINIKLNDPHNGNIEESFRIASDLIPNNLRKKEQKIWFDVNSEGFYVVKERY